MVYTKTDMYSECNWTASGQMECNPFSQPDPRILSHYSDGYGGLNRELEVSVYSPRRDPNQILTDRFHRVGSMPSPGAKTGMKEERRSNHQPNQSTGDPRSLRSLPVPANPLPMLAFASPMTPSIPQMPSVPISIGSVQWSRVARRKRPKDPIYYFQTPAQKYDELVQEFGEPTLVNPQPGGMAVWQHPGTTNPNYRFLHRMDLVDEQRYNSFPYPHIGFLYTYVSIKIPIDRLSRVLSLSGDVMYDPVKSLLIVRGMSLNYNLSLTALVVEYINNDISWYQLINQDLIHQITHHKRLIRPKDQKKNMSTLHKYISKRS